MLDFLYSLKKSDAFVQPSWFAFVDTDDAVCEDLKQDIPENVEQVRLVGYSGIPMFALFYSKELKAIDPYEALNLLAEGRISFRTLTDKEMFVNQLSQNLNAYDRATRRIEQATHVAAIAGCVLAGVSAAGAVVAAVLAARNRSK